MSFLSFALDQCAKGSWREPCRSAPDKTKGDRACYEVIDALAGGSKSKEELVRFTGLCESTVKKAVKTLCEDGIAGFSVTRGQTGQPIKRFYLLPVETKQ